VKTIETPNPTLLDRKRLLLMWGLFFAICFGLGYPTLQRYDPRYAEGMSDTPKYYAITTGADTSNFKEMFRCRVLVPFVAKPFYWFALRFLPNWNAGFFGLLIANCLFCATTACFIIAIGNKLFADLATALLGATLYLLSFNIPNLQLAGLIDSGEAFFLIAVVWSLLNGKWFLLPVWAIFGALAKETFVPFSCLLAFTWWLIERREKRTGTYEFIWVAALALVGLMMVSIIHSVIAGMFRWPWQIAGQARAPVNFFIALWHCLSEHSFWYLFGWLLPLGIWRLKFFPRPWVISSAVTASFAILLGAYSNAGGTVGRATFNIIGPLLSLSVAFLLTSGSKSRTETSHSQP
jgi:hypothetical protein